jgi:SAM-dependent methyltransferase
MYVTCAIENIAILQCPYCGGGIKLEPTASFAEPEPEQAMVCISCGRVYPVISGVPDFMVDSLISDGDAKLVEWRNKLVMQELWWRKERDNQDWGAKGQRHWSPSVEVIKKYLSLGSVKARQGRLLDVGSADGSRAKHFPRMEYLAIDPVVLSDSYEFPFFKGMAEFLPFADSVFDVVISIESIDHFLDPAKALNEATRVLSAGGTICLFVRDEEKGKVIGDNEFSTSHYSISEEEVHLHCFSESYFRERLSHLFERVEVVCDNGYLAVWGWSRK